LTIGFFGFLTARCDLTKDELNNTFQTFCTIRQSELSLIVSYNQKLKILIKLSNEPQTYLNELVAKLLDNPNLGNKPLSDMKLSGENLNKVSNMLAEQFVIEEKIE